MHKNEKLNGLLLEQVKRLSAQELATLSENVKAQIERRYKILMLNTVKEEAASYHSSQKNNLLTTLSITLPSTLNISDFDLAMIVTSRLFEQGKLSSEQAAEILGISQRSFLEKAGEYDVSIFGYTSDELLDDLKNV